MFPAAVLVIPLSKQNEQEPFWYFNEWKHFFHLIQCNSHISKQKRKWTIFYKLMFVCFINKSWLMIIVVYNYSLSLGLTGIYRLSGVSLKTFLYFLSAETTLPVLS